MRVAEWQVVGFTFLMALWATLAILPIGVVLAWFLARKSWPGKSVVETLVALPLVMPPVATGLILLKLLGRRGPIGSFLNEHFGLEMVFTWRAVVIAMAVMSFPLLVRGARIAFEAVNPRLEQVAATLGASPLRVFATITLPLALRGIVAGSVLSLPALGRIRRNDSRRRQYPRPNDDALGFHLQRHSAWPRQRGFPAARRLRPSGICRCLDKEWLFRRSTLPA
jgi:ABC-type molybdate transport system permease subunit